MHTLIFATNNPHKTEEIRSALGDRFRLITLNEAGISCEIPEPHDTLEKNAGEKSWTIRRLSGQDCFSEDTGLEVDALDGRPGVRSARYAGDDGDAARNIARLLDEMSGIHDRRARFRTVISLILHGSEYLFTGICEGRISLSPKGENGFGYDPVFIPQGADVTFAEMDREEKNRYSHRRKALEQLIGFLNDHP
jgi:XTP/dITP diphosphohydrolase